MLHILNTFRIKANNSFLIGIRGRHADVVWIGFFFLFFFSFCSSFFASRIYRAMVLMSVARLGCGWRGGEEEGWPLCLGCGSLRGLFLSLEMATGAQGAVWMGRTTPEAQSQSFSCLRLGMQQPWGAGRLQLIQCPRSDPVTRGE